MNEPFLFVVGSGRSGTTLLRAMLDAHPDLTIPGESYFIEQMARRRDGFRVEGRFDREAFEAELFADLRFQAWNLAPDAVRAELDRQPPADLADAIRGTYRAAARRMGTTRWGDKTPSYALCVPTIAALLPESVFVHLVRDPRDVAASYARAGWGPRSMTAAGHAWRSRVAAATAAGRALGPSRYLEVRYEDLVAEPRTQLEAICRLVELAFDPRMLDYRDGPVVRRSLGMEAGAHTALIAPPTVGLRDWRTDLTDAEAARVGAITDRTATGFGYPPSPAVRGMNRWRSGVERAAGTVERASLAFRRTRLANRLRGPWRRLRGRATLEQLGIPAEGVT
ncbi:MAG: sulfotransferase [Acidimicrobiales bacterium]